MERLELAGVQRDLLGVVVDLSVKDTTPEQWSKGVSF